MNILIKNYTAMYYRISEKILPTGEQRISRQNFMWRPITRQRNKTGFHLARWSVIVDTVLHFAAEPRFSLYNRYSKDYFLAAVN